MADRDGVSIVLELEGLQLTKRDRPYEALIKADWSEVGPCTLVR